MSWTIDGVGVHPLEAAQVLETVFAKVFSRAEDALFTVFGVHQFDVAIIVDVGVVVGAGLPAEAVDALEHVFALKNTVEVYVILLGYSKIKC